MSKGLVLASQCLDVDYSEKVARGGKWKFETVFISPPLSLHITSPPLRCTFYLLYTALLFAFQADVETRYFEIRLTAKYEQ